MPSRRRTDYAPNRHLVVDRLRQVCLELGAKNQVLPGEAELASQLSVGRATLRDALTRLEAEGLLLRRKGADTIVNAAALDLAARIDLQVDFSQILKEAGFAATIVLLEDGVAKIGPQEGAALGAPKGTRAFRTVKRWDADDRPVMVAVDWILMENDVDDLDPMLAVFDLATKVNGEEISWEIACPGAVAVTGAMARWLSLPKGSPVWTLERVGIGRHGRRSYLAVEYHVPLVIRYGFIRSVRRP